MIEAALLLAAGVVAVLVALKLLTFLLVQRWSETLDFRGPVRAVEVILGRGEVTVRGSDRTDARVRRRLRHGVRRPKITEHVDDGVLHLRVGSGIVRYEIDVPRRASVLVRGDHASATVIGMAGAVELRAGSGSLEGRALSGSQLSATTSAGSIRLSFDRAPRRVDVTTDDGAVDLALPDGPYDVDAGDARIGVPCAPGCDRRVRARSSHGTVAISRR